jgi:hypothetical protein
MFLEIDGVEGESEENTAPGVEPDEIDARATDEEAAFDAYIKIPDIEGESEENAAPGVEPDEIDARATDDSAAKKKGNVEYNWKVEEGEKMEEGSDAPTDVAAPKDPQRAGADYLLELDGVPGESAENSGVEPDEIDARATDEQAAGGVNVAAGDVNGDGMENAGIEPDEIDVAIDTEPLMTSFGLLLGGGSDADDKPDEGSEEAIALVEEMMLQGLQESGVPVEQISLNFEKIQVSDTEGDAAPSETLSLNFEKIKVKATQPVRLFGLFPLTITATVDIQEGGANVDYPWWGFLVSGKDDQTLGTQIVTSVSNVFKSKHDMMMNAIRNMK